jgi:hypothetical protein
MATYGTNAMSGRIIPYMERNTFAEFRRRRQEILEAFYRGLLWS